MQKFAVIAVAVIAVVWVALVALAWRYQERVVYQPPRRERVRSPDPRLVRYTSKDGIELIGYLIGDPRTAPVVMLAFHGNADVARWLLPWGEKVARSTGAAVFLPEYRGYDGLEGTPTYATAILDARAALAYLHSIAPVNSDHLVYYGHSLGSAVAAELATDERPSALILQSPFTSAREMAGRFLIPGASWVWPRISRIHFDTERCVRALNAPVWVAHGERDRIIPVYMGRAVFSAARQKGELLLVPSAGHNDVAERAGADYWSWLRKAMHVERSAGAHTSA